MIRLAALMLAATTAVAAAQDPLARFVTPEATVAARLLALRSIDEADCGGGPASCAPASEAELAEPPISLQVAEAAMQTGLTSALMQWCDLDWEARSFLPLMNFHREVLALQERNLTLMALIHGIQQERILTGIGDQGCPPALRLKIHQQAPGPERNPGVE